MKRLGLLRHAKSDWNDSGLRDFDRGLNPRGQRGAAAIGRHIAELGIRWDTVIASPAERVRRTLEASGLGLAPEYDGRVYLADGAALMGVLSGVAGDPATVLLVGHNPGLQELLVGLVDPTSRDALFARAAEKFPTAAFALLDLAIEAWPEIAPDCARLTHFIRPRDLDPELGPGNGP